LLDLFGRAATAFVTNVTVAVTNTAGCRIRDIQVGRFRITLERAGLDQPGGMPSEAEPSVVKGLPAATYSNGRGERVRAETPSPSLLIPVANIPSHLGRVWKTA
jgi:hypothetical protein